jgi:hypothetical protein
MHISSEELARLRAGSLAPADALRVLEHRAVCAECRAMEARHDAPALRSLLDFDRCPARTPDGEQRLVDFSLGRLQPDAAAEMTAHTHSCAECSRILRELREDRASVIAARRSPSVWWRAAIAAALVLAMIGGGWLLIRDREGAVQDRIHDGGALIALSRSGEWSGVALADGRDRELVLATLRSRHLPAAIGALRPPDASVLRGNAPAGGFELRSPVYTRIEEARPRFTWSGLPGAVSYRVAVFSMDMQLIEVSPPLAPAQTSWESTKDLPRGVRIGWQVTAERRNGDPVLAPAPPAAPVYFEAIGEDAAQGLARARATNPPSRLLLAAIYAQEGMRAESRRELEALARSNPESPVVKALLAGNPQ